MKNLKKVVKGICISAALVSIIAIGGAFGACTDKKNEDPQTGVDTPVIEYDVKLNRSKLVMEKMEQFVLTATATKDGVSVSASEVAWANSNPTVARFDVATGKVVALAMGSTTITATYQGIVRSCEVTVSDNGKVPTLTIGNAQIGLYTSDTAGYPLKNELTATFNQEDTSDIVYRFTSQNPSVVTVDSEGNLTVVGKGTTQVNVQGEWRGYSGSGLAGVFEVTVVSEIETQLVGVATLYAYEYTQDGYDYQKTATLQGTVYEDNSPINVTFTWYTDNADIVSVDQSGNITAVGLGNEGKYGTEKVGVAHVWYTATVDGEEYTSRKQEITVSRPIIDKTNTVSLRKDANFSDNPSLVTADVTGFTGTVTEVCDATDSSVNLQGTQALINESVRDLLVYSSDGYAYKIKADVATKYIKTASDLQAFVTKIKNGVNSRGWIVKLGADISSTGDYKLIWNQANSTNPSWSGTKSYNENETGGFRGTFDGNGYKIDGFTFGQGGLFGDLLSAQVKNLSITNATLRDSKAATLAMASWATTVENCYFDVTVGNTACGAVVYYCMAESSTEPVEILNGCVVVCKNDISGSGALVGYYVNNTTAVKDTVIVHKGSVHALTGTATGRDVSQDVQQIGIEQGITLTVGGKNASYSFTLEHSLLEEISYVFDNESVAEMSSKGVLTARNAGNGMVTVGFTVLGNEIWYTVPVVVVDTPDMSGVAIIDKSSVICLNLETYRAANNVINVQEIFGSTKEIIAVYDATDTEFSKNLYRKSNIVDLSTYIATTGALNLKLNIYTADNIGVAVSATVVTMAINDIKDLKDFKAFVNASNTSNGGTSGYYVLTNNINATGETFSGGWGARYINGASDITTAINNKRGFNGVFNGQGYTISNVTFGQGGLFGALVNATVKNVNFANAYLDGAVQTIGSSSKGQSPLFAQVVIASTVQNCTIDVSYSSNNTEIGIFGYTATNSSVFKDITITYTVSSTSHRLFLKQVWDSETTGKNATFENIKLYYKGTKTENYYSMDTVKTEKWFTTTNVTNEQYVAE